MKEYDFDPYGLPTELRAAIGLAIAGSVQTETILNDAIGGCLGMDSEYTIAITQHMPLPLKLSVLHSVAEIRLDDLDDLDELDALLANVKTAFDKRNAIAHESFARQKLDKTLHRVAQKARVRVEIELTPVTVEEVINDATFIIDAGLALWTFLGLRGLLPDIPSGNRPRGHKSRAARKKRRETLQKPKKR